MHLPKLWDRFVQNLRRAVGYDVQYFAVIEPQRRHPMATARELMSQGVECVSSTETLVEAARKMRDLDVGALPICGEDQRLKGMLTDRDIVVNCIAEGKDPNDVTAADLAQGKPVTIGADDSAEETLRTWRSTRYAACQSSMDTNLSPPWPRQTWRGHSRTRSLDRFWKRFQRSSRNVVG